MAVIGCVGHAWCAPYWYQSLSLEVWRAFAARQPSLPRVTRKDSERDLVCGLCSPGVVIKDARYVRSDFREASGGGGVRSLARFKFAPAMRFPGRDGYMVAGAL